MIQGARLHALLPHAGAMVLLDALVQWDASSIHVRSRSHLDPHNPLRRAGRLAAVCGVEYGLQAAALHGALLGGGQAQRAGVVAGLRDVVLHVDWLDDPAFGTLAVQARLRHAEAGGMVYDLSVAGVQHQRLVEASATVVIPPPAGKP